MQCLDEEGLPMTKLNTGKGEIRTLAQRSGLFKALLEGNKEDRVRFDFDSLLTLYNFGNHLQAGISKRLSKWQLASTHRKLSSGMKKP